MSGVALWEIILSDHIFFVAQKWIGRRGTVQWVARSPDLTPLDYFLWSFIKSRVMATAPMAREDMKGKIGQACSEITIELIKVC